MAIFHFPQLDGEQFHNYFSRLEEYVTYYYSCGYNFHKWELCHVIKEGMNPESWILVHYMSNGMVLDMDDDNCWDFFCNMASKCLQDEQEPMSRLQELLERSIASNIGSHAELGVIHANFSDLEAQVAGTNEIIANTWRNIEAKDANDTLIECDDSSSCRVSEGKSFDFDLPMVMNDDSPLIIVSSELVYEFNNEELSHEIRVGNEVEDLHDEKLLLDGKFEDIHDIGPPYAKVKSSSINHEPTIVNLNCPFMSITLAPLDNIDKSDMEFVNIECMLDLNANEELLYRTLFNHVPCVSQWIDSFTIPESATSLFDKLQRVLTSTFKDDNLSNFLVHFGGDFSQEFDKMLRTLTMSNLKARRVELNNLKQSAS